MMEIYQINPEVYVCVCEEIEGQRKSLRERERERDRD
jgi:hypothetical protein